MNPGVFPAAPNGRFPAVPFCTTLPSGRAVNSSRQAGGRQEAVAILLGSRPSRNRIDLERVGSSHLWRQTICFPRGRGISHRGGPVVPPLRKKRPGTLPGPEFPHFAGEFLHIRVSPIHLERLGSTHLQRLGSTHLERLGSIHLAHLRFHEISWNRRCFQHPRGYP